MSDELIRILAEASISRSRDAAGMTTLEIMRATGWSRTTTRARLAAAIERGAVRCAGWRMEPRVDGQMCRRPVYQVVKDDVRTPR